MGEGTHKIILSECICHFDEPTEIMSDNDVSFSQEKGFTKVLSKQWVSQFIFSLPRRSQSNGLCEKYNGIFFKIYEPCPMNVKP